jgi:hypothetical protein
MKPRRPSGQSTLFCNSDAWPYWAHSPPLPVCVRTALFSKRDIVYTSIIFYSGRRYFGIDDLSYNRKLADISMHTLFYRTTGSFQTSACSQKSVSRALYFLGYFFYRINFRPHRKSKRLSMDVCLFYDFDVRIDL